MFLPVIKKIFVAVGLCPLPALKPLVGAVLCHVQPWPSVSRALPPFSAFTS